MTTTFGPTNDDPGSPAEVVDVLFGLFAQRGDAHYDEAVSQTEHALQAAALAVADGAEDALVVAALLHDVGHLLDAEPDGPDRQHERVGAAVLERWFPAAVTEPIALHVPAKRYLVATEPSYAAGLSPASVRSLEVQGGPMSATEVAAFVRRPHAEPACRLRRWDDEAKAVGLRTPSFEDYRRLVEPLVTLPA